MSTSTQWVDLSSNNPLPDLAQYAAAGHRHITRKVSEGDYYHWQQGDRVADEAHARGLTVGHYHWLRPDNDPSAQVDWFLTLLAGHWRPGDCVMTDFERTADAGDPSDSARARQLATFNARVSAGLPLPLHVYTGNWYLDGCLAMQAEVRKWPVVMSDYSNIASLPNPYGLRYVAWQFTETAHVPGIDGAVDYNRWLTPYPPETVTPEDDDMAKILLVDKKDCAAHGARWPGYFLLVGGSISHIATTPTLNTYSQLGYPLQTISLAQYHALGGK